MPIKIEAENRVFPASNKSKSVLDVFVKYMKDGNVSVLSNSPVDEIIRDKNIIEAVKLKNGKK